MRRLTRPKERRDEMRSHELCLRIFTDELLRLQKRYERLYHQVYYCPFEEHRAVQAQLNEMMLDCINMAKWGKAERKKFDDLRVEARRLEKAIDRSLSAAHTEEIDRLIEVEGEIRDVRNEICWCEQMINRYSKQKGGE